MKKLHALLALVGIAFASPAIAQHDQPGHAAAPKPSEPAAKEVRVGDPWPLDTCVVSGGKLGSMGDPIIRLHEGREVRFCCAGCVPKFEADPAKYLAAADEKIVAQQKAAYPLDHCIVETDTKLPADESERAYSIVGNRLFVFCCAACDKEVRKDPAKHIAMLDAAAIARQKPDYPLTTCAVSGEPLDSMGGPVDRVVAGQLVRLCCTGCAKKLESDPAAALAKIAAARAAKQTQQQPQ